MAIDELQRAIEQRLIDAREDVDRLEGALHALKQRPVRKRAAAGTDATGRARETSRRGTRAGRLTVRQAVLDTLGGGEAMTAGQLAEVTGLRATTIAPEL